MISYVPTDQLNLRPLIATIERLEKLAKKYKGDEKKKNEVAVEILERYIDSWEDAEIYQRTFIESQKSVARKDLEVFTPADTHAPAARGKGEIEGTWSGERPMLDAASLSKLSDAQLNELPYGVIRLAADGTILRFNKTEKHLSRVSHKVLVGKNFFSEIAPCTNVRDYRDRFKKFLVSEKDSEEFEYTYRLPAGTFRVLLFFYKESESTGYVVSTMWREQAKRRTGQPA